MRKKVLFTILFLFLMLNLSFVLAEETTEEDLSELDKVEKAYQCLEDKIEEQTCEDLSTEEKIFSLLAVGDCKAELIDDSREEKCWPKSRCDTKTTAQAILALDRTSFNTEDAEEWLLSQNTTLSDIVWYLQIESNEPTTCIITYAGSENTVDILEDKKVASGAGHCLTPSSNGYWLEVESSRSSGCYEYEYSVSCEDSFLTTLLFQKPGSSIIHVSERATSAAAAGATIEKIDSFCFMQEGLCDYEASLWAAFVLHYLDYDVSGYMPFLVTMQDEYEQYIPGAFLYLLTGYSEFRSDVLLKQKINKYWIESGDKYYDTALALYPFKYEDLQEKANSKEWLLENQDREGCWEGNIRNTAFILHSLWQDDSHYNDGGEDDDCSDFTSFETCEENIDCEWDDDTETCKEIVDNNNDCGFNGGYCMPGIECDGSILDYDCNAPNKCCSVSLAEKTCEEQGGQKCASNQKCSGKVIPFASDVFSYETCCDKNQGFCQDIEDGDTTTDSECKQNNGVCRESCHSSEETANYDCTESSDDCCVDEKIPKPKPNYLWLWILIILIILTVLGIVFKDKLRPFWIKIKSGGRGRKRRPPGFGRRSPGPPPGSLRMPLRKPSERRVIPSSPTMQRPGPLSRPRPKTRPNREVDDVLKKLKEMGK